MNTIEIRSRGFALSQALSNHCQMRFDRAIRSCARQIRSVTVILLDINGDHGGEDKSCRAILGLAHGATFTVEAIDRDLYRAVARAAQRLKQSLRRRLRQHHGAHPRPDDRSAATKRHLPELFWG
jgi:putative sigma-54 modulation protein